jgi:hypothetical protein
MLDNLSAGRKILATFGAFTVFVALSGGLVAWAVTGLARSGLLVGEELAPHGKAAVAIKLDAARAQLALLDMMAGGGGDISEVEDVLAQATANARAIQTGGVVGSDALTPTRSDTVRAAMDEVLLEIARLGDAARAGHALLASSAGVGTGADAEFDGLYDALIVSVGDLAARAPGDAMVQQLAGEARYLSAHGHLMTEEVLGGDASEDISEGADSFTGAAVQLERLAGERPDLAAAAGEAAAAARRLSELAITRFGTAQTQTSDLARTEAEVVAAYGAFVAAADRAEAEVRASIADGLA